MGMSPRTKFAQPQEPQGRHHKGGDIDGESPSRSVSELGCWFLDREERMVGMGQSI